MIRILIAGSCGFIGSNLAIKLKKEMPKAIIYGLDNLNRRGSELNLKRIKDVGVIFIHGDTRIKEDINNVPIIDFIVDASAEPSVMAGINSSPSYLLQTNLQGTQNLIDFALKNKAKFIFLSTNRVYSINALNKTKKPINENFSTVGYKSLYGVTKLTIEQLLEEYSKISGLNFIINRCGVVAGKYQMGKSNQGVVALWMFNHFFKRPLSYIGFKGSQSRDILHIDDLTDLLILEIKKFNKFKNQIFNVGGGKKNLVSLREMTKFCEKITKNRLKIDNKNARIVDIKSYVTDISKIIKISGWYPKKTVKDVFSDIYAWLLEEGDVVKSI